jgi:hypothetical protein
MSSLYKHTLSGFHKQKVISELSENLNLFPYLSMPLRHMGEWRYMLHALATSTLDALIHISK